MINLKELRSRVTGAITTSEDSHYERMRRSMVWNQLAPQRRPRIIVQAANENAVVEAVRFARANGIRIAVRGGGHSWIGMPLRDDSLLIDLGRLRTVSLDRDARIAVIQPAVTSRDFNRRLAAEKLAFPVGHCPTVPMSGFLLSGGIGWNFNAWGPSCCSIESVRVVTADGRLVVASEHENAELLWAARGAGPGFFGIVTEYTLRVFPAPGAIISSTYCYPVETSSEIGEWASGIAGDLPSQVELTVSMSAAPAFLGYPGGNQSWVCSVTATAFAESQNSAASMLRIIDSCPLSTRALHKTTNLPTTFESLHEMNAQSTPAEHRYLTHTLWTNLPIDCVLEASRGQLVKSPSSKSIQLLTFSKGTDSQQLADCAYSMGGEALLICSATWERGEDDAVNSDWHQSTVAALNEYAVGHYIGETDIFADPRRAERSYSQASWARLKQLRHKYDPDRLFHGFDMA